MSDRVDITKLEPGDVLLIQRDDLSGRVIRWFDGGETNHAALFLGNDEISEAVLDGVSKNILSKRLENSDIKKVIVRRLNDKIEKTPVLDVSTRYVGLNGRYAMEQNLILAVLCLTRRVVPTGILRRLIRRILDAACTYLLEKYIKPMENQEAMICSEFVYRCYDEAMPGNNDPYTLQINQILMNNVISPLLIPPRKEVSDGSLLGWANANELIRELTIPTIASFDPLSPIIETDTINSDSSIEQLMEQYEQEVKKEAFVQFADLQTPEMLGSITEFARLYNKVTLPTAEVTEAFSAFKDIPDVYRMLLRTASDFVTPNDLECCMSLKTIGDLEI